MNALWERSSPSLGQILCSTGGSGCQGHTGQRWSSRDSDLHHRTRLAPYQARVSQGKETTAGGGIVPLSGRRPNAGPRANAEPPTTRRDWVSSSNTLRPRSTATAPARSTPTPSTTTIHHYHRAARELWIFCWSRSEGTVCGPRGGVAGAGPWAPALVFLRDGACGLTVGRLPGGVAETPIARPTTCCRRHAPTFSGRSSS